MTPLYPADADHTGDTVLYRERTVAAPAGHTERERELELRAVTAETRLEIARGTALRALAKVRELEAAIALDRLSRTVTGQSAAMTAEELTVAMSRWPDVRPVVRTGRALDVYEADTEIVDTMTGEYR